MVSVPESLERLLANLGVGGCIHQKHAQHHNVTSDTSSFRVVDLNRSDRTNLVLLDVKEAVIWSADVAHLEISGILT